MGRMKRVALLAQEWLRLKAEGWYWWYPQERPSYVLMDWDGNVVAEGPTLGADEVICDICNAWVAIRPVPALGSYAVCPGCFFRMTGIRVEEAAYLDGVDLMVEDEEGVPVLVSQEVDHGAMAL